MKTLILYATKHGATREIAQRMAQLTDDTVIFDLKQDTPPSLEEFDRVIIGSSVYAGMIRNEAKAYLAKYADKLTKKKFGLFISGMDQSRAEINFSANFSQDILEAAQTTAFLGGIFDPQKAGAVGRLIMKMVAKKSEYSDTISDESIKKFWEDMKAIENALSHENKD